jgi:hypothetical protein
MEVELDKYVPIDVENGTLIEDEHGAPLVLLARHTIPQEQEKQINVRFHPSEQPEAFAHTSIFPERLFQSLRSVYNRVQAL